MNTIEGHGRLFPGYDNVRRFHPSPGDALWLEVQQGDVISCHPFGTMHIAVFDHATGDDKIDFLLGDDKPPLPARLDRRDYDDRMLIARLNGLSITPDSLVFYPFNGPLDIPIIWRVTKTAILVVTFPESLEALVCGTVEGSGADIEIRHNTDIVRLPVPLGEVIDEFTVKRATAKSYQLPKGCYLQIIDVEGRQCSDFMAFDARALDAGTEQHIDSVVSRTFSRGAYPRPGLFDKFYDSNINPLLAVVQDTVGRHDTFALACTARGYEERGFPGHVNCSDNISVEMSPYGVQARAAWPAINFFFNTWILPHDNTLQSDEAWSRPGDYVMMRALTDLVCVSTACPDDIDPINGWNPTDIHVRIYSPKMHAKSAIAYRLQPNDEATMTTDSPFYNKTKHLTQQYNAHLDYWTPQFYDALGAVGEYWHCREKATMQDMSNLRIYDIAGIDALPFLQKVTTRDIGRVALNKGVYTLICDESGYVLDDCTLFNIGPNLYRLTCGNNNSLMHLREQAKLGGFHVRIFDKTKNLCTLSVQGPLSRDILASLIFTQPTQPKFFHIPWFGGCVARLHNRNGASLYVSRTGYTGGLGYELFCSYQNAETLWDAVTNAGGERITPMGTDALSILRIEAGLAAMGNEFGDMIDAFDAGLGFAVDLDKGDFIGAEALRRNASTSRNKLIGLQLEGNEIASHSDKIYQGRRVVGVVTSGTYSPILKQSIAIARVAIECAKQNTKLEIGKMDGQAKRLSAVVCAKPFVKVKK